MWTELKSSLIWTFFLGAEDLHYRQQLTQCKQRHGELVSGYVAPYNALYGLAYTDDSGNVEEQRAVGSFLRGLSDQPMLAAIYRKLKDNQTMDKVIEITTALAGHNECYAALVSVAPSPSKCKFAQSKVLLLGYTISEHGISIRKLTQFNYVTYKDYLLVYPDGTEVKTIQGSSERFTISHYKEEIGKPYCRIKLFLCPKDNYKGMWMEGYSGPFIKYKLR